VIPWEQLDERERAVWAATVAARFVQLVSVEDTKKIEYAVNLADRAVYALREQAKRGPYR
jgi:hypothetical protein